jgi:hypothetical protein
MQWLSGPRVRIDLNKIISSFTKRVPDSRVLWFTDKEGLLLSDKLLAAHNSPTLLSNQPSYQE